MKPHWLYKQLIYISHIDKRQESAARDGLVVSGAPREGQASDTIGPDEVEHE
jgi:hypothetical protein